MFVIRKLVGIPPLFYFLFVLVFYSNMVSADAEKTDSIEPVSLLNSPFTELGTHLETIVDKENDMSPFELVLDELDYHWEQVTEPVLNLGYQDYAYWIRVNIDASSSIHKQWDLVISNPLLDYVDVYQVFTESGPRLIYRSGMNRAFNNRNEDHRFFIIPLEIYNEPSSPITFLIHVQSESTLYMPMQLYPANEFWAPLQKADIYNWMFFGIIIAMMLYNLFLYLSVRDISYLYYVLFITSFALLQLSLDGYIFQHFWPDDLPYTSVIDTLLYAFSAFFGFLFITNFLNLKRNMVTVHRLITVATILVIPLTAVSLYYEAIPADKWMAWLMAVMLITALLVGFYAVSKGFLTARYFMLAWVVFALGNLYLIVVFSGINLFPVPPLYVSKTAAFAETMLLSFALARRIRVLRDEQEKQKLKAEAQSYFLAQISHEIRTPLNGVLGTVDLLEHTELDEEQHGYVEIIQSSGKSLLSLVNEVLDYSKIEAGKMVVINEQLDLHKLVTYQVELFRSQAIAKNIELKLSIEEDVPIWIYSDSHRLRQIFSNLIANALKFIEQGSVIVHLLKEIKDDENVIVFKVKDTGPGIAAAELNNLFNAYQQIDISSKKMHGGTGLGLAISRELIHLLDGEIKVASQLNQGTEFIVTLPYKAATKPLPSIKNEYEKKDIKNLSILVAEDNFVNQKVIQGLLTKIGHNVVIVKNGEDAVEEIKKPDVHYDVVLMDCEMPILDGYEATKLIRLYEEKNNLSSIPIVALTAHALEEVRHKCLESGMSSFLTKPINTHELARTINQIGNTSN